MNSKNTQMELLFNDTDREVILLRCVIDLLNSMVNKVHLRFLGPNNETSVFFESRVNQQNFYIHLLDFLSKPDEKFLGKGFSSYLDFLVDVLPANPSFNWNDSLKDLSLASSNFRSWLQEERCFDKRWFPSIDREIDVVIKRIDSIKICGNISKHNLTRLTRGPGKEIKGILPGLNPFEELMVIDDFYEIFHDDILNYYSSMIVEFLNDIRWGVQTYLKPHFNTAIVYGEGDPRPYSFNIPENLSNAFSKHCYHDLMNSIRGGPFIDKFKVTPLLKMRY